VVFVLYWFVLNKNFRQQNILLLLASYFFYACWDWRFLFLLMFSTFLDFSTGIKMSEAKSVRNKKVWFWFSIFVNLGFLGVFKYYNFFAASFAEALNHFGFHADPVMLQVILPVGISFYTFHGLSYVIDIYYNRIRPERNLVDYSVFVSFFPLLVAGPIERATHLLPQIQRERVFNLPFAVDGMRQILWGLFKKVVIADQCAEYANMVFNNYENYSGSTLVIGAVLFAFQIYCDFSGYSDIALGTAKLFGISLLRNFAYPYFSRNIAEFWRRWHISLSTWFRDYLYIPLGGSKGEVWMKVRNTFIIFIVSGFWHGANWTFIIWGLLNALFIMPSLLMNTNRHHLDIVAEGKALPSLKEFVSIVMTFCLAVFAWIFFRAETLADAIGFIKGIFSSSLFEMPEIRPGYLLFILLGFLAVEWAGREQQYALARFALKLPRTLRWTFYMIFIIMILYFSGAEQQFIYFQF
jgi:D-alanyl-lipoteichoic acid acyltransferase DltB (MBOAT superfamily)